MARWDEDESSYPPASLLVVDDRPANLIAVESILAPLGHRIVLARSGQEALAVARAQELAVILMDVHMPLLDGFAAVERLRREDPTCDAPIVFMSAVYDDTAPARRGYELGGVDYVMTPIDPELLRAKVASFVSLFRRGRELRRRAELIKERTKAAERAEHANRLKDTYLAVIGHDLRNPLEVIALTAETLASIRALDDCRVLADRLRRAAKRAEVIVGEVLDFTRGELGGGIPLSRAGADFGDAVRAVVHDARMLHPERKIALEVAGDLRGRWDVQRVEQALTNLVANAVEHGTDAVSVHTARVGDAIEVRVHNGGRPILQEALPSLFEPFHRSTGT